MSWVLPMCCYDWDPQSSSYYLSGIFESVVKQSYPSCLTMETARDFVRNCRASLESVPFIILRGKGSGMREKQFRDQRRAFSASGEVTAPFQCKASRSFHMDEASGMPMLQFNTLITHYKPNPLTGRLMFSGNTSILSSVVCMPEQLKESGVCFLQKVRWRSMEKQFRDQRLAVERINGDGGVVMSSVMSSSSLWWRTTGRWGEIPLYPDLDPCDGSEDETKEMGGLGKRMMELER